MTDYDFVNEFIKTQKWQHYVMPKIRDYRHENYWKTSYEKLSKNTLSVVSDLARFLNVKCNVVDIIKKNDFEVITGRERGSEFYSHKFERKGIVGDWVNWLKKDTINIINNSTPEYVRSEI
jgi:hypothetical protein